MTTLDFTQGQNCLQAQEAPSVGLFPFYKNNSPFERGANGLRPLWGMTMKAAGSMRFRWNETNPNRDQFLAGLCERCGGAPGKGGAGRQVVPLELIHSKIVYEAREAGDTFQKQGDAIITKNAALVPVVTVADCVPLYFYDAGTGAFGAAHSGWKGTGIAAEVVLAMKKHYGSDPRDILCAIGPHIHDCCYLVDGERAKCFAYNFGSACVQNNRLSLLRANLSVLEKAGVLEENIAAAKNCTACDARFGSFRREAAALPDRPGQDKSRLFTTQAAFVIMKSAE